MQSHICDPQVSLFVYGQPMRHVESETSGNRAHYNYGGIKDTSLLFGKLIRSV